MLGWPYEAGGSGPFGIDCVAYCVEVLRAIGVHSVSAAAFTWAAMAPGDVDSRSLEEFGLGSRVVMSGPNRWRRLGGDIEAATEPGDIILTRPRKNWLHVSVMLRPPFIAGSVAVESGASMFRTYQLDGVVGVYRWVG